MTISVFFSKLPSALAWRWKYRFRPSRYRAFIKLTKGLPVRYDSFFPVQRKIIEHNLNIRKNIQVAIKPKRVLSISVVIPHYNQQEYLSLTIRNILAQTYPVFEILVVDDKSSNIGKVEEIEKEFKTDKRVRFIYPEEKLYAGGARQRGSEEASGDAILYIDSDDLMHRQRLELAVHFMNNHPDCVFLVSGYIPFTGVPPTDQRLDYNIIESNAIPPRELTKRLAWYFSIMRLSWIDKATGKVPWYAWGSYGVKSKYPAANGSIIIRREYASIITWPRPTSYIFTPYEDYEYCLLMHVATNGGYKLDTPLLYYRKGSTTNDPAYTKTT